MAGGGGKGFGECFVHGFQLVVVVFAVQHLQVQVHHGAVADSVKEFPCHLHIHAAAALPGKAGIINKIRPSAKVHSAQGQRFVHGQHAAAVTHNAGFVAKGLTDGRAKRDAAVFNCVVTVHVQVAITV